MKKIKRLFFVCCTGMFLLLTACGKEDTLPQEEDPELMRFTIIHPAKTRVTDTQFEASDRIGLFVTETGTPLQVSGNYVNNSLLTFSGTAWEPVAPVWYNDGTYDAYAYYPYSDVVTSVDDYPFEISTDQSALAIGSVPGGYESSDFLWASQTGIAASASPVPLKFSHRMSRIVVRLLKGSDYEGDIPTDAEVFVHNTVTSATIDMSVGIPTVNSRGIPKTIQARRESDLRYSAIVVPQRLNNRRPLVEVVMKGVSYMMESAFVFKPGIQHTVSLIISRNPEQVKIEFGGENEGWESF